nr:immunoglobulin heavy chain junction region [Mus musculus]
CARLPYDGYYVSLSMDYW